MHVCLPAYMHACFHTQSGMLTCLLACMLTSLHTCMHGHVCINNTCLSASIHACLIASMHASSNRSKYFWGDIGLQASQHCNVKMHPDSPEFSSYCCSVVGGSVDNLAQLLNYSPLHKRQNITCTNCNNDLTEKP